MDMLTERRQHISWNINQDPVSITITRTEKTRSGGGFTEATSTHGPYTVRIYLKKSAVPQDVSNLAGTKQLDKSWGMLAGYTASLMAGPNVKDEFDVAGIGHFVIKGVIPQMVGGQVAGYQADIEKVL